MEQDDGAAPVLSRGGIPRGCATPLRLLDSGRGSARLRMGRTMGRRDANEEEFAHAGAPGGGARSKTGVKGAVHARVTGPQRAAVEDRHR
jgi:hypothetical protein